MRNYPKSIISLVGGVALLLCVALTQSACTKTETTDPTPFALYYTGLTDIGPSMSGTIASPTYLGSAPYDFAITGISLDGTPYTDTDIFVIDAATGSLTLNSTRATSVGLYKISISCYSDGTRYDYPDIVTINMMKPIPTGISVLPASLEADYGDVRGTSAQLPTAQVTTDGDHISIKGYRIAAAMYGGTPLDNPTRYFSITGTGLFSIVGGNTSIQPGQYIISLRLVTGAVDGDDEEGIFADAIRVNITSKPISLTYSPAEGLIEEETAASGSTTYISPTPAYVGSEEELAYAIERVEPATEKIAIDPATGILSVAANHGLTADEKYIVSVRVANKFAPDGVTFADAFTLNVVPFISPIANFSYAAKQATQAMAFTAGKAAGFVGDEVRYEFVDLPQALQGQVSLGERDGIVSAAKGNTIPTGTYDIKVRAYNTKSEATATLALTVIENPNFFTYISYGNNLGLPPAGNYASQYRTASGDELKALRLTPSTDLKPGAEVKWSVKIVYQASGTTIDAETGVITPSGFKAYNCGIVLVTATAGTGDEAVTVQTPLFFHYAQPNTDGLSVEYSPFVLQANPKNQVRSAVPVINGLDDTSNFVMDYRRNFNYFNFNGKRSDGTELESGQVTASPFLQNLWKSCGSSNYSSKLVVSYFGSDNTPKTDLVSNTLAYVDNTAGSADKFSVVVNANKWYDDGWANGCFIAQMTYVNDGNTGSKLNSGTQVFPLVIWFDTKF